MKTFDAENKTIGRVASEVAKALMGKDSADYQPNVVIKNKVQIKNASKAKINMKKLATKKYQWYTGYPGGLRERTLQEMIDKKGYGEIFKKAVYGMLPDNKLRSERMKKLEVIE
jgi:large subunit ribosomal protein L13